MLPFMSVLTCCFSLLIQHALNKSNKKYASNKKLLSSFSLFLYFPNVARTCCLDRPFVLTEASRRSLVLSSELSLLRRHLGLECCHLASQEPSCPSVDAQRKKITAGEITEEAKRWSVWIHMMNMITLKVWNGFNGEHTASDRGELPAHSCGGGVGQPRFSHRQDVLRECYTCRFATHT